MRIKKIIYTSLCILSLSEYAQLSASENSLSTTPPEDLSLSFIFSSTFTLDDKEKTEERLKRGACPNAKQYNDSILHSVIKRSNDHDTSLLFSQILCKHNVDVNVKNKDKETPLTLATKQGNKPLVTLLLKKGALPNERDRNNNCPIHVAMEWDTEKENFFYKKRKIDPEMVMLLLKHKADPNALYPYKGATPLHAAVFHNAPTIIEALLYYGAKKDARDDRGWTPLKLAQEYGYTESITILLFNTSYTPPAWLTIDEEIDSFHVIEAIEEVKVIDETPIINVQQPFFNNIIVIDDYQSTSSSTSTTDHT
jgi:ankyrin repeat protein